MNYGTPLRQSHPAEVERFIVDKVRADIGKDILPYVTLRPILQVEREEGDISGDMTAGYGTVEVKVDSKSLHLPFIIQNRELLPFETIRMDAQEVGYAPERLRAIIVNLRERLKEDAEDGELVSRDEVTSGNGFLGTIMTIRDEENMRNMNGLEYKQDGFGLMEQARTMQRNASEVDSIQTLEKIAGLIKEATVIPREAVESYLDHIEKQAAETAFDGLEKAATYEEEKAERLADQIEKMKLVDFREHRSGNNVYLPLFHEAESGGTFEKSAARVYHDVETFGKQKLKVDGIVIGPNGKFKLVADSRDKLMTYRDDAPESFDPKETTARALAQGAIYTYELSESSLITPFIVTEEHHLRSFTYKRVDTDRVHNLSRYITKSLSIQVYPTTGDYSERPGGIIVTPTVRQATRLTTEEAMTHFGEQVEDPSDLWDVNSIVQYHPFGVVLLPPEFPCFPLLHLLKGTYDKPELVRENMFTKTAAYNRLNTLTLKVQGYQKPQKFTVEWATVDAKGEGASRTERVVKQYEKDMPYEQARNFILLFGFSHNQVAQLFRTVKRSNREATMPLPDVKKASELSRDRIGRREKAKRKQLLLSRTVNNQTFGNDLSDVISFGIAAALETAGLGDRSAGIDAFMKQSATLANTLEKTATDLRGEQWLDLAALANIKHRLDKVACAIEAGDVLENAEGIFKEAATLRPKIEKLASELVPFARLQQNLPPHRQTDPTLIKEAQTMLDVLYGYATLDKSAGVKDFFGV